VSSDFLSRGVNPQIHQRLAALSLFPVTHYLQIKTHKKPKSFCGITPKKTIIPKTFTAIPLNKSNIFCIFVVITPKSISDDF